MGAFPPLRDGSGDKPDEVLPARSRPPTQRAAPARGPGLRSADTEVREGVRKEVGCALRVALGRGGLSSLQHPLLDLHHLGALRKGSQPSPTLRGSESAASGWDLPRVIGEAPR